MAAFNCPTFLIDMMGACAINS